MNFAINHHRAPDQYVDRYPVAFTTLVAGGAGDNTEVNSDPLSVLGTNADSALAHGVTGVQYEALEAEFFIRVTLANTESLVLKNLMWQHADPDASGDPDTFTDVTPVDDIQVDIITLGSAPFQNERLTVGVTADVRDDITVHTASGPVTDGLFLVRLKQLVRVPARTEAPTYPAGKEFWRLQFTPDLSAGATDTADIALVFSSPGNVPAYTEGRQ